MIQFEELTDGEWALIEELFSNEAVPPERSGRRRAERARPPRAIQGIEEILFSIKAEPLITIPSYVERNTPATIIRNCP